MSVPNERSIVSTTSIVLDAANECIDYGQTQEANWANQYITAGRPWVLIDMRDMQRQIQNTSNGDITQKRDVVEDPASRSWCRTGTNPPLLNLVDVGSTFSIIISFMSPSRSKRREATAIAVKAVGYYVVHADIRRL